MTEKEFSALLVLEGRELQVAISYYRGPRIEGRYKLKRRYKAWVTERGEELTLTWVRDDGRVTVVNPQWYASRAYAVKKLITDYYANNR